MSRDGILYWVMKMYRYTDKDREIITAARKANKDKRAEKRLHALELRASGKSAEEVAAAVGFHASTITRLTEKYKKGGIEAISGNHYGGNRRNMSVEKEAEILEPFRVLAEKGQMLSVEEIKKKYEVEAGHSIGSGQIYRVLHRHDWRKVMPRSKHPKKASEEEIDSSKKLISE